MELNYHIVSYIYVLKHQVYSMLIEMEDKDIEEVGRWIDTFLKNRKS